MERWLILCLLSFVQLTGCKQVEKSSVENVFYDYIGKPITGLDDMCYEIQGVKIDDDLTGSEYTIINYVDSCECTACRLKLEAWKQFMSQLDSSVDVRLITVICSQDTTVIRYYLKSCDFNYPVVIDKSHQFKAHNNLPSDPDFHTFVLNDSNEILTIGNPVLNNAIWNAYLAFFNRGDVQQEDAPLAISAKRIDLGWLKPGQKTAFSFTIANNSDSDIELHKIVPSCECIYLDSVPKVICRNHEHRITGMIMADSIAGPFKRELDVFSDVHLPPVTIAISGIVAERNRWPGP